MAFWGIGKLKGIGEMMNLKEVGSKLKTYVVKSLYDVESSPRAGGTSGQSQQCGSSLHVVAYGNSAQRIPEIGGTLEIDL